MISLSKVCRLDEPVGSAEPSVGGVGGRHDSSQRLFEVFVSANINPFGKSGEMSKKAETFYSSQLPYRDLPAQTSISMIWSPPEVRGTLRWPFVGVQC